MRRRGSLESTSWVWVLKWGGRGASWSGGWLPLLPGPPKMVLLKSKPDGGWPASWASSCSRMICRQGIRESWAGRMGQGSVEPRGGGAGQRKWGNGVRQGGPPRLLDVVSPVIPTFAPFVLRASALLDPPSFLLDHTLKVSV